MSKKIFKYPLRIADMQIVQLPLGYRILSIQSQGNIPTMWAMVDDEQHQVNVKVLLFGTGHEVPDRDFLNYHGTCQLPVGNLVFHVFTDDSPF